MPFRTIRGKKVWINANEMREIKKNGFAFISGRSKEEKKELRVYAKSKGMRWHETKNTHVTVHDLPNEKGAW